MNSICYEFVKFDKQFNGAVNKLISRPRMSLVGFEISFGAYKGNR